MKKEWAVTLLLSTVIATVCRNLFAHFPNDLLALFVPVDGSVWEELKLLLWPMLLGGIGFSCLGGNASKYWGGFLGAILVTPVVYLGIHYLLLGAFGVDNAIWDGILYYSMLYLGIYLASYYSGQKWVRGALPYLIPLVAIFAVFLMAFTFATPNWPIFMEK